MRPPGAAALWDKQPDSGKNVWAYCQMRGTFSFAVSVTSTTARIDVCPVGAFSSTYYARLRDLLPNGSVRREVEESNISIAMKVKVFNCEMQLQTGELLVPVIIGACNTKCFPHKLDWLCSF